MCNSFLFELLIASAIDFAASSSIVRLKERQETNEVLNNINILYLIIAASIYIACRVNDYFRTAKEIATIFNLANPGKSNFLLLQIGHIVLTLKSGIICISCLVITSAYPSYYYNY